MKALAGISLEQNLQARLRHGNINLIYDKGHYSKPKWVKCRLLNNKQKMLGTLAHSL